MIANPTRAGTQPTKSPAMAFRMIMPSATRTPAASKLEANRPSRTPSRTGKGLARSTSTYPPISRAPPSTVKTTVAVTAVNRSGAEPLSAPSTTRPNAT